MYRRVKAALSAPADASPALRQFRFEDGTWCCEKWWSSPVGHVRRKIGAFVLPGAVKTEGSYLTVWASTAGHGLTGTNQPYSQAGTIKATLY